MLRRAFRLAERSGAEKPSAPFPTIQVNNVRSGFFEEDEFRLLLHHLPSEIQPMVIFAYHTGWWGPQRGYAASMASGGSPFGNRPSRAGDHEE